MGKQKRQRRKPHKENPTGLPSVKEFTETEEIQTNREKALQNVYGEIQSCNFEEKLSALQTLESMACDVSMAVQIAKNGIAKLVGPLLIHSNSTIRAYTASTLRQIADNSEGEAYAIFIKDDIMTPLTAVLKQYYSEWQPGKNCKGKEKEEKDTFIQVVTLLWVLVENSETVVKCINDEDLVTILMKFLNLDIYGVDIITVTIQCLTSVSENNYAAIQKIKQERGFFKSILKDIKANDCMSEGEVMYLKVVTCTLLLNIKSLDEDPEKQLFRNMCSVLFEVLTIEHQQLLSRLISDIPHESNISSQGKKRLKENRQMLNAQQQALETLTNLCFDDDDNATNSISDDEMEIDIGMNSDSMNYDIDDRCRLSSTTYPVELLEVLNHYNLIDKIWDKTKTVDEASWEILDQTAEGKTVLRQFETIQNRAYFCLNNLLYNLEIEFFGGIDFLYKKWLEIGKDVFKNNNIENLEFLEAATAIMRGIVHRLADFSVEICTQLTAADVQVIINIAQQCSDLKVRVNIIRMLGSLVLILLNNQNSENLEMVKNVSLFLLETCVTESEAYVIAEILDAIMDMYADDKTNKLAADICLVSKLQSLVSIFKTKTRQQRKQLGNTAVIVSTVNTNIIRFIKYKENQLQSLK